MPLISDSTVEEHRTTRSVFSTTHWSVVLKAGRGGSPEAAPALECLCRAYWYPLYAYVRRKGRAPHDAQDLVQDFFAHFLKHRHLRLADRARGRFRTFLLTALQNFLVNEWRKTNRLKRGGSVRVLSLDEDQAESRFTAEPTVEQPSDLLYDRGWAAVLLERALAALRAEFEQSGRLGLFERLKGLVWGEGSGLPYETMARQLGMTESGIKVAVHRLRQRYGELLRHEIAQTVATPLEVDEELRYLISIVRSGYATTVTSGRK